MGKSKNLTKSALIVKVAEKCGVKTRAVKDILDAVTTEAYAELKKTGMFKFRGWAKFVRDHEHGQRRQEEGFADLLPYIDTMQCLPMAQVVDKLKIKIPMINKSPMLNKNPTGRANRRRPRRARRARQVPTSRRRISRKLLNKLVHALNGNTPQQRGWQRAAKGGKGYAGGKGRAADKPLTHADLNNAIARALSGAGGPKATQHTMPNDPTNPKVPVTRDARGQELRQDPSFAALCPPLMLAREDFLKNHGATKGKKLWNEAGKQLAARAR
eukprot:gene15288-4464_t